MSALRDDKNFDLPEINAPSGKNSNKSNGKLNGKLSDKLSSKLAVNFKQSFSSAAPVKVPDEDRCYSKELDQLVYLLLLITIIMIVMMMKAYSEEGFGKGIKDAKTEAIFREIMNAPPSS